MSRNRFSRIEQPIFDELPENSEIFGLLFKVSYFVIFKTTVYIGIVKTSYVTLVRRLTVGHSSVSAASGVYG